MLWLARLLPLPRVSLLHARLRGAWEAHPLVGLGQARCPGAQRRRPVGLARPSRRLPLCALAPVRLSASTSLLALPIARRWIGSVRIAFQIACRSFPSRPSARCSSLPSSSALKGLVERPRAPMGRALPQPRRHASARRGFQAGGARGSFSRFPSQGRLTGARLTGGPRSTRSSCARRRTGRDLG